MAVDHGAMVSAVDPHRVARVSVRASSAEVADPADVGVGGVAAAPLRLPRLVDPGPVVLVTGVAGIPGVAVR